MQTGFAIPQSKSTLAPDVPGQGQTDPSNRRDTARDPRSGPSKTHEGGRPSSQHHLVVVGFDEIVANKYLPCISEAIDAGYVDSYSIIDLESERPTVEKRIRAANLQPRQIVYLPDPDHRALVEWECRDIIGAALSELSSADLPTKVYIETEVRAHEAYLRYCVDNGIDSLVEKPVLAPMANGRFAPSRITETMKELTEISAHTQAQHSVMTLSRYHGIYNERVISSLRDRMTAWRAPLTSFHLRAAGGVWNLQNEYETREDHPYKYGYGMMMHGAYHYVDLAVQFLSLNKLIFPDRQFKLEVSSFSAFPVDQHLRIPSPTAADLEDHLPRWPNERSEGNHFGETDVTSTFRLVDSQSCRTLTVGTLSFEQTTPSIRTWRHLPESAYNKNGRTSSVDLEAQLSTLYSAHVHCYDIPRGDDADSIDAFAQLTTRANASLLPDEQYTSVETFDGLFHSESNRQLMDNWLEGTETRSSLATHFLPMKVTEALSSSLLTPGQSVEISEF